MGARHSNPTTMTLFGHVLDVQQTVNEIEQRNYDTIDTVVDTIIRTTGGVGEAIRFISENPINSTSVVIDGQTRPVGLRAKISRCIIAMNVILRIPEWTPEAEQARRAALLEQARSSRPANE